MYFSLFLAQMSTKRPKGRERLEARKPRPRPTYVKKDVAASALRPYAACAPPSAHVGLLLGQSQLPLA